MEQGLRVPNAAARAYLDVIAREPHLVAATWSPGRRALRVCDITLPSMKQTAA
jgi:hypothetical protein